MWTVGSLSASPRGYVHNKYPHRLRSDPATAVPGGTRFDCGPGRHDLRQSLVHLRRLLRAVSTRLPGRNHDAGPAHLRPRSTWLLNRYCHARGATIAAAIAVYWAGYAIMPTTTSANRLWFTSFPPSGSPACIALACRLRDELDSRCLSWWSLPVWTFCLTLAVVSPAHEPVSACRSPFIWSSRWCEPEQQPWCCT